MSTLTTEKMTDEQMIDIFFAANKKYGRIEAEV